MSMTHFIIFIYVCYTVYLWKQTSSSSQNFIWTTMQLNKSETTLGLVTQVKDHFKYHELKAERERQTEMTHCPLV